MRIGVHLYSTSATTALADIQRAEALGIGAVWFTLGGASPDPLPILAAAALRTQRIQMGTSIIPTYPRHPLALAQAARAVAELAPGRFRLGVGPSHKPMMEGMFGLPMVKPLAHLREYVQVLKAAVQQGGRVEFEGEFFQVRADCGPGLEVPVLISALRPRSFALAGEVADGAITWVTPLPYVQSVALPALAEAAARAGRPRPALVMHAPVAVHENRDEVYEAAGRYLARYVRLPFYQQMFAAAGLAEAAAGQVGRPLVDAVVLQGREEAVADGLRRIAAAGVTEVICTVIPAGPNPAQCTERTLRLLGELSR